LTALSAQADEPAQTKSKPVQDRFMAGALSLDGKKLDDKPLDDKTVPIRSTKTAEAGAPTGAAAATRH